MGNLLIAAISLVLLFGGHPAFAKVISQNANLGQKASNNGQIGSTIPDAVDIPPPLAVALPISNEFAAGPASMALAWRSRALSLANEYPVGKDSLVWILPVGYIKGQNVLKEAIKQNGLELLSEYAEAGQFLLSIPESNNKGQVIIVSQPVADKKTLFRMRVYSSNRLLDSKRVSILPETMKNLLENKDLWQ